MTTTKITADAVEMAEGGKGMSETIFTGFREGESPAPIISMDVDTGEISGPAWDCYQACAAINPVAPVKVAEALPELVRLNETMAEVLLDDVTKARLIDGAVPQSVIEEVFQLVAKLKAQP